MHTPTDKPWRRERAEPGPDLPLFSTRIDHMRNPRNGRRIKALVVESPDWVDVVALTPQKKLVMVEQYRYGIGRTTIEIPAGLMEPGETPQEAIRRELREETGYAAAEWRYLGWVETNPAYMNNVCHQFLALDVVACTAPSPDGSEDIAVSELTLDEVRREIREGRMRNIFGLMALARVFDLRDVLGSEACEPPAHPLITDENESVRP